MIIDGKAIAAKVRAEVALAVKEIEARAGVRPGLALVRVGNDPASEVYVRGKVKACQETGMAGFEHILPQETSEAELLALVRKLNVDPSVHGVLVQLPLPRQIDPDAVLDLLAPQKDVDGFGPHSAGALFTGRKGLRPCTPVGICGCSTSRRRSCRARTRSWSGGRTSSGSRWRCCCSSGTRR